MEEPQVTNAANEGQVKKAAQKQKDRRDKEIEDLKFLLQTQQGRRFIWRMLSHCKVFGSVWEQSARIHYNAGIQDVGHFLMAEVIEAKEDALLQMMKEAKGEQ